MKSRMNVVRNVWLKSRQVLDWLHHCRKIPKLLPTSKVACYIPNHSKSVQLHSRPSPKLEVTQWFLIKMLLLQSISFTKSSRDHDSTLQGSQKTSRPVMQSRGKDAEHQTVWPYYWKNYRYCDQIFLWLWMLAVWLGEGRQYLNVINEAKGRHTNGNGCRQELTASSVRLQTQMFCNGLWATTVRPTIFSCCKGNETDDLPNAQNQPNISVDTPIMLHYDSINSERAGVVIMVYEYGKVALYLSLHSFIKFRYPGHYFGSHICNIQALSDNAAKLSE